MACEPEKPINPAPRECDWPKPCDNEGLHRWVGEKGSVIDLCDPHDAEAKRMQGDQTQPKAQVKPELWDLQYQHPLPAETLKKAWDGVKKCAEKIEHSPDTATHYDFVDDVTDYEDEVDDEGNVTTWPMIVSPEVAADYAHAIPEFTGNHTEPREGCIACKEMVAPLDPSPEALQRAVDEMKKRSEEKQESSLEFFRRVMKS